MKCTKYGSYEEMAFKNAWANLFSNSGGGDTVAYKQLRPKIILKIENNKIRKS